MPPPQGIRNWLAKNAACAQDVMIATCNKTSREKHISRDQVGMVWVGLAGMPVAFVCSTPRLSVM
jgi:hypothetical protein